MEIDTTLACGHEFHLKLPDRVFDRGALIAPCPKCGERYLIRGAGVPEHFAREPIRFLAMHY